MDSVQIFGFGFGFDPDLIAGQLIRIQAGQNGPP
jgi:hypothetical protein